MKRKELHRGRIRWGQLTSDVCNEERGEYDLKRRLINKSEGVLTGFILVLCIRKKCRQDKEGPRIDTDVICVLGSVETHGKIQKIAKKQFVNPLRILTPSF